MTKRRIAIVGLGMAVAPHARSLIDLCERVEVTYAFSPSKERREAFAKAFPFPIATSLAEILEDGGVDAVLLLTPPNTHLELVRHCAEAGKHVLLEKPVDISTGRAEALVEAAREAGTTLAIVLQHRFRPAGEELKRLLDQGKLGALVGVSCAINNWRPQSYYDQPGRGTKARDGGGVLLTQAIHTLDLMIALAGSPVEVSAYAVTSPVHRMETEDMVAAAMRYAAGALGTIAATTCAYPGWPERIEILGEKGTALLEGNRLLVQFHDGRELKRGDESGGGTGADPMAFKHDAHRALITDFLDALDEGREPRVSGSEALKVHYLIDAILSSAAQREPRRVRGAS